MFIFKITAGYIMDINEYIGQIPKQRVERFNAIIQLITHQFPSATASLKYKMPTFEFEGLWIAVGNQKNYISVYTCVADHLTEFKLLHPQIKTGKGCINIKDNDDFPIEDLLCVINSALSTTKK